MTVKFHFLKQNTSPATKYEITACYPQGTGSGTAACPGIAWRECQARVAGPVPKGPDSVGPAEAWVGISNVQVTLMQLAREPHCKKQCSGIFEKHKSVK